MTDETFQPRVPDQGPPAPAPDQPGAAPEPITEPETAPASAAEPEAAPASAAEPGAAAEPESASASAAEPGAAAEPEAAVEPITTEPEVAVETVDRGPAFGHSQWKSRLVAVVVMAAVAALALLACTFLGGHRAASPADEVLSYVGDCLPDNATDVALETVGLPGDTVLLTANGVDITAEEYLYWLGAITSYQEMLSFYTGSTMDLTQEAQPGVTWDQQLKLAARDNAVLLALVPDLAHEFGVELTPEDYQSVADRHTANIDDAGGADKYAYQLQGMGVSDATALRLDATTALYNKVQDVWLDQLAQGLTDQDVADYAEEADILRAKHILLSTVDQTTGEPLDDETVAQKRAQAEELLAQLRADPSQFDALMNANSEDSGLAANPDGYTFTAGEMVEPFEAATRALEYGQISDVVESDYGYHIILRLDPDSEDLRQEVAYQKFTDAVQERVDQTPVEESDAYASFTTADYYQNLLNFQSTLTYPETPPTDQETAPADPEVVDQSQAQLEPAP